MEAVIEAVAGGLGNSIGWMAQHWVLFGVFAVLWLAVAAALVANPGALHELYEAVRALPILVQAVVWLLFLPVMAGLWIWETTWPLVVRLALVIGLAGWNLLVFLPRAATTVRP
jgi:hypothetical protein